MHFHTIARPDLHGPGKNVPHLPTPLRDSWLGRCASIQLHDQISVGFVILSDEAAIVVLHLGTLLLRWVLLCLLSDSKHIRKELKAVLAETTPNFLVLTQAIQVGRCTFV